MGACCSNCLGSSKEAEEKQNADISDGLVKDRGCTDIFCLIIFLAHWVAFIVLVCMSFSDGNPYKLYSSRDFRGNYCGIGTQWKNGRNYENFEKQSYMMNVSSTTDLIAKQLVCSSAASDLLFNIAGDANYPTWTTTDHEAYLCDCCLTPCAKCDGSLDVGSDFTITQLSGLSSTISAKMGSLRNVNAQSASDLFNPAGPNGDFFTNIWSEATSYFTKVCINSCATDYTTITSATARSFVYMPTPDQQILAEAWALLSTSTTWDLPTAAGFSASVVSAGQGMATAIASSFTFEALPESQCNYPARYCVPMPGLTFVELSYTGYCQFQMAADVVNSVGSTVGDVWETLGGDAFAAGATETFGMWIGDLIDSIGAFSIVCVCSFLIGFIYLVLLRFFIRIFVWLGIICVVLVFAFGGGVCYVRSYQCKDASLFDTSTQSATAVAVVATTALSTGQIVSEELTGDGHSYRGVQTTSINGRTCQAWDVNSPWPTAYNSATYPNDGLTGNYCRNPYNDNDPNKASTIWCYTTDTEKRWEECLPVGVIQPPCDGGYAVPDETARDVLEVVAYIIWGLGGVWILLIFCFINRIRLAIKLNCVAAQFVQHTPLILTIPIVQSIIGILWQLLWAFCAAFIISQVADDYVPDGYYSYYDAAGETNTESKCMGKWPMGGVWKDEEDCGANAPNCFRCYPPRYIVMNGIFEFAFFSYLWNNAFGIAVGQCVIAGAVAVWFFTENSMKGKKAVIRTSLYNTFRFHTGSLAFGAFILAVVQFIRYLMKYFEKQAEAQKNRVMVIILKVVQCCIWCFEQCIKFLNKNAYIQVAMRGTNFCTSAKKAFQIIMANLLRFGTVAVLGYVVACIGYLFIMAATVVSGYFILKGLHPDMSPTIPIIMYAMLSYTVGVLFMNVFGMAVDTCLQCVIFAEEKGILDSNCPPQLKDILHAKKTSGDDDDK